ncbi:hypothetical protein B0H11DRAFT_2182505 [Mycena galericulata]|nr:hypothetical protein B0H11DRAFT_2182505 [Mycena galericulata]
MLPYALKLVWFVLSIVGTIGSLGMLMAVGSWVGSRCLRLSFSLALIVLQLMFCLGMIWHMDPFAMPREFCLAQAILMNVFFYVMAGLGMAWCIQTASHIKKPKSWGNIEETFKWLPIYILPVIVYPLLNTVVLVTLVLKYDAVQPTDGMYCDATDPLWIQLVVHAGPPVALFVPATYISVTSILTVRRTLKHVERARHDQSDYPRQMRRDRQSAHYSFKQSPPLAIPSDDSPPSPGRQPIEPTFPVPENTTRPNFHLPFFRQLQSISQTLTPPSSSRNPSPNSWNDGRASVASSSFPTFAPVVDKSTIYARHKPGDPDDIDITESTTPWLDGADEDSAPTSVEGHETPEQLELDIKTQAEDDDQTFRLSYRETANNTPSRVSHVTNVPNLTTHILIVLTFQFMFCIALLVHVMSSLVDVAMHRETPTPFASHQISLLASAWGPVLVFGSSSNVRAQLVRRFAFWR